MRVTVLSHSCVVRNNQGLYEALRRRGVDLQLVVPRQWRGDLGRQLLHPVVAPCLADVTVPVTVWVNGSVPCHLWGAEVMGVIDSHQPDVVFVENETYAFSSVQLSWLCRSQPRRRLVFRNNQNLHKRYPWVVRRLEGFVLSRASGVAVVNAQAEDRLRALGYRGACAYLPYSLDPLLYQERPSPPGLPDRPDSLVFGYVGRLVPEKGIDTLLDAFMKLDPTTGARLCVIGDGPLRARVEAFGYQAHVRDRFRLASGLTHAEIPRQLQGIDVLVLPSLSTPLWVEQFGRVIIEALLSGVPVIGSDSGEIPHLLGRTGGGLVVPEGDASALAAAMLRLMVDRDLRAGLAKCGRSSVLAGYTHSVVAAQLHLWLESLCTANSGVEH